MAAVSCRKVFMEYKDFEKWFSGEASGAKTPAYVFSGEELLGRLKMIRENIDPSFRVAFAMKANPFVTGILASAADCLEICSPGEERICERADVPPEKMVLSGVNKEEEDFLRIMKYCSSRGGGAVYTAESTVQAEMLNRAWGCLRESEGKGQRIKVLLRLTSGNQFGMDEDTIARLIRDREKYANLDICGLQLYSGTQKSRPRFFEEEIAAVDAFISRLQEEFSFITREFEYGPGLFVPYFLKEGSYDDAGVLHLITELLHKMKWQGQVTLEIGRFLAAYCGYYVTRIMEMKENRGVRYCILDGGIHQVSYFGQMMAMKHPHMLTKEAADETDLKYNLCGSLCTVSDVLVKEVPLHRAGTGDILVFERTGAYSVTEGISLFLSRDLPRVYMYENEKLTEVRKQIFTEEWNYGRTD